MGDYKKQLMNALFTNEKKLTKRLNDIRKEELNRELVESVKTPIKYAKKNI